MRRNTPLITLLTGGVLGIILLIASMLATPSKAGYGAATTPTPGSTGAAVQSPSAAASSASTATASSIGSQVGRSRAGARADFLGASQRALSKLPGIRGTMKA